MKTTAKAPANIAFIKYWGKRDSGLRLPMNSSFSMNLDGAYTVTTVEFTEVLSEDDIAFSDDVLNEKEKKRIADHLDRIRAIAKLSARAKVVTKNSFPKGTGSASSASGFAALTQAAATASGLHLDEKALTILARIGSGSACRSIPDGFVLWEAGTSTETSYAYTVYPSAYWRLCDVLVIVDTSMKKVPTTEGQEGAQTSPFFEERVKRIPEKLMRLRNYFDNKQFQKLGELIEEESLDMHHIMQTQNPPLFYWTETTKQVIADVRKWRTQGLMAYCTVDAGPNVHIICEEKNVKAVATRSEAISGVHQCVNNSVSDGTRIIRDHLF